MIGKHLIDVRSLMVIRRYSNKFKLMNRSVAEHTFMVTKLARVLSMWETRKFMNPVDMEKVLVMALEHDTTEYYLGDIISTTKNMTPELKAAIKVVENLVIEQTILPSLPQSWRQEYREVYHSIDDYSEIEGRIVKAADMLDCVFECLEEIKRGNKEPYEVILTDTLEALFKLSDNLYSLRYFMKYPFKDIGAYDYLTNEQKTILESNDFSKFF